MNSLADFLKRLFVGFFAAFVMGLVLFGFIALLSGCQREPQHWQMYRFDKNWNPHRVAP